MYCTKEERENYQNAPAVGTSAGCAWGGVVVVKIDDGNGVVFWCFEYDGKCDALKKSRLLEGRTGRAYFYTWRGVRLYLDEIEARQRRI